MLKIKELKENEIVWPLDVVKSIEKLWRATYHSYGNTFLVIWWIEIEKFEEIYNKCKSNSEIRDELKKLGEEHSFIQLS
jgi:hypothetical protein